jgi:hypothetical protein
VRAKRIIVAGESHCKRVRSDFKITSTVNRQPRLTGWSRLRLRLTDGYSYGYDYDCGRANCKRLNQC